MTLQIIAGPDLIQNLWSACRIMDDEHAIVIVSSTFADLHL
jgi:hypothetical protein